MNTPDEFSPEERRLQDALNRAADQVTPGPDGLAQIRRRLRTVPWWRSPVGLGLVAATVIAAAVIAGGFVVLGGDDTPVASTTSSPRPTSAESPSSYPRPTGFTTDPPYWPPVTKSPPPPPTESSSPDPGGPTEPSDPTQAQAITLAVYYTAVVSQNAAANSNDNNVRLVREFHDIETADPPLLAALRELASPDDPDYDSFWRPEMFRSAEVGDDAITVEVTELPAVEDVGLEPSNHELAVQQVVYTVTAAADMASLDGSLPVRFTVGGEPAGDYGGIDLSQPVGRADPLAVRQLVQINNPAEGTTVSSPVTIDGQAAAFEAQLDWEIRLDGEVVEQGYTTAEQCCTFADFAFEVELEPGTYEIVVSETDPSGGEGRSPMADSKTFTVE